MALVGGFHQGEKPLDDDEVDWILAMQDQVEQNTSRQFENFTPVTKKTQVVAGLMYWVRVMVDNDEQIFVKIFKPLPHTNAPPELKEVIVGKQAGDEM